MSKNTPNFIKFSIFFLFLTLIVSYVFFNTRIFIKGPQVILSEPYDGQTLTEKLIRIKGLAQNISFISINDRTITIDEQGHFDVPFLLQDGYNVVLVKAHDKFNRQVTKKVDLVYNILR
jgi:hypothetical protein